MLALILQSLLEDLMEQIGILLQLVDARRKQMSIPVVLREELRDCMHAVLRTITSFMIPAAYFEGIIRLLRHADKNLGKKVLTECAGDAQWDL